MSINYEKFYFLVGQILYKYNSDKDKYNSQEKNINNKWYLSKTLAT